MSMYNATKAAEYLARRIGTKSGTLHPTMPKKWAKLYGIGRKYPQAGTSPTYLWTEDELNLMAETYRTQTALNKEARAGKFKATMADRERRQLYGVSCDDTSINDCRDCGMADKCHFARPGF